MELPLVRPACRAAALFIALPGTMPVDAARPDHPLRTVVPLPPGQATGVFARTLADRLSRAFGQPFVIENRSGTSAD